MTIFRVRFIGALSDPRLYERHKPRSAKKASRSKQAMQMAARADCHRQFSEASSRVHLDSRQCT